MKFFTSHLWRAAAVAAAIVPAPMLLAQQSFVTAAATTVAEPASASAAASFPAAPSTSQSERWIDLDTLSYSGRYRNTVNDDGRRLFEFGQQRYMAAGRIKADRAGRYFVGFHASSGRYFNWSYTDLIGGQYKDSVVAARSYKTAAEKAALAYALPLDPNGATYKAGIPSRGGYFTPRQLYFSATPVDQLTVEFGSLYIEHGQNTEITSFDDDGYISGERVRLHDPKHFYFDQIAVTSAYLGSPLTPDFIARGADLKRGNYSQYLIEKKLPKRIVASADYTLLNHTHTFREAASIKLRENPVIDGARFELYQRTDDVKLAGKTFTAGSGFAVSAHHTFFKKAGFEGGYATVDERYSIYSGSIYLSIVGFAWNGDAYETGKRGFAKLDCKLGEGVSLFGFYTHAVTPITIGHNEQGFNAGLNFDVKSLLSKKTNLF